MQPNLLTQKWAGWPVWFILTLTALLAFRIWGIIQTPLNLGPDEAQYWRWGDTIEWGYFSKPPLTSWFIAISTGIFGDAEWAIRLPAPILHVITASMLFLTGRAMFSANVGVMAALVYVLMPGVWLSSAIMSTDTGLLALWSIALFALWQLRQGAGFLTAVLLGAAIGSGFLAKYAMVYFLVGLALVLVMDEKTRQSFLSPKGALAGLTGFIVFLPHILWNAQNDFKTVGHTADNANWGGQLFNPQNGLEFLGDQFGIFGPISFIMLLIAVCLLVLGRLRDQGNDNRFVWLCCFILPPLIIIIVQAVISRAHGNWAASAYPAAAILVAGWAAQSSGWTGRFLKLSILFNLLLGLFVVFVATSPASTANEMGLANAFKRLREWPQTAQIIADKAKSEQVVMVIVDEREVWHGLDYYGIERGVLDRPLRAWRREPVAKSASENALIELAETETALVIVRHPKGLDRMRADFKRFEPNGKIEIELGGGKMRRFDTYLASGYAPLERDDAYYEKYVRRS